MDFLMTDTASYTGPSGMYNIKTRYVFASMVAMVLLFFFAFDPTYNGIEWVKAETILKKMYTMSGRFTSTSCTFEEKTELMKTPLSIDQSGEVNIDKVKTSGCFAVYSKNPGIHGIFDERNFMDTKCLPIQKRFLNVTGKEIVTALASIPGSGNTWTRHLIEEITGVHTGSEYKDRPIEHVFKGGLKTHNVMVVKTHDKNYGRFGRAVVIARDPFESTLANYNLARVGKIGIVERSKFNKSEFTTTLNKQLGQNDVVAWINNFKGDLFILYYEKLTKDLPNSLIKLASFLKAEATLERLWCTVANKNGWFKRKEKPEYMSRKVLVNNQTEKTIQKWKRDIHDALARRSLPWSSN